MLHIYYFIDIILHKWECVLVRTTTLRRNSVVILKVHKRAHIEAVYRWHSDATSATEWNHSATSVTKQYFQLL